MKNATAMIVERFPGLEKELKTNASSILIDQTLNELSDVEQVFLKLAWFFEEPDNENFNLESIYKHLQDQWLEFALEVIYVFFRQDTYLLQDPSHLIIRDGDYYMNQSRFAEFLNENGLKYDRAKLKVYIDRGKVPKPDIIISGTMYWERSTCEKFLHEQKKEQS